MPLAPLGEAPPWGLPRAQKDWLELKGDFSEDEVKTWTLKDLGGLKELGRNQVVGWLVGSNSKHFGFYCEEGAKSTIFALCFGGFLDFGGLGRSSLSIRVNAFVGDSVFMHFLLWGYEGTAQDCGGHVFTWTDWQTCYLGLSQIGTCQHKGNMVFLYHTASVLILGTNLAGIKKLGPY